MSMDVNVAVVGDEGVGKTSLILSATQRNFTTGEPITALPGTSVKVKLANADCRCICHDSTSRNMEEVNTVIRKSDVVLLCFSMAGPMSLHSAIYTWLPHISKIDNQIPILIVGCREDQAIVTEAEIAQLDASVNQAANLVRYDKCSAMHPDTTAEVFQHACDACVNPMLPLYHHVRERLRSTAIRAFNRIFDIVDEDRDGALSDTELNQFHVFAFGRPPRVDELNGLKQALMERAPDSVTTLGITRSGFMQLQAMMIQQQRLDICWNMLRSFGYNRQLILDPAVYQSIPEGPGSVGMVCMLSATAVEFLKSIFRHRCTSNNVFPVDLLLQDTGPASLFHNAPLATSADELPLGWANIRQLLVRSADPRYLPLESFLSIWAYCAMMNPRKSVMAMMYLGYPDGYGRERHVLGKTAASQLLVFTPRRKQPNVQPVSQPIDLGIRVISCLLLGSPGCGKSHLLELLSGCPQGRLQHSDILKAARLIPGHGKHSDTLLVMHEVPMATAEDLCIAALKDHSKQNMLVESDIMLFGFDSVSSESYAQARSLLVSLSDASNNIVPVALVGLKADLGVSSDITAMAAADCEQLKVKLLRGLSIEMTDAVSQDDEQSRARDWASQVVELACHPAGNIAMTPSVVAKRVRTETMWRYTKYFGATAAVIAGLGIAYQVYHHMSVQASHSRQDRSVGQSASEPRQARTGTSVWTR